MAGRHWTQVLIGRYGSYDAAAAAYIAAKAKDTVMTDRYTRVSGDFITRTRNAVQIDFDGCAVWVPRSLIHGADDADMNDYERGETISFRLMEWKAREIGL